MGTAPAGDCSKRLASSRQPAAGRQAGRRRRKRSQQQASARTRKTRAPAPPPRPAGGGTPCRAAPRASACRAPPPCWGAAARRGGVAARGRRSGRGGGKRGMRLLALPVSRATAPSTHPPSTCPALPTTSHPHCTHLDGNLHIARHSGAHLRVHGVGGGQQWMRAVSDPDSVVAVAPATLHSMRARPPLPTRPTRPHLCRHEHELGSLQAARVHLLVACMAGGWVGAPGAGQGRVSGVLGAAAGGAGASHSRRACTCTACRSPMLCRAS